MEHGRKCIEMQKELIELRTICMKGMKGSLKGQASRCAFMNLILVKEPGPSCTELLFIEELGWSVLSFMFIHLLRLFA